MDIKQKLDILSRSNPDLILAIRIYLENKVANLFINQRTTSQGLIIDDALLNATVEQHLSRIEELLELTDIAIEKCLKGISAFVRCVNWTDIYTANELVYKTAFRPN